MVEPSRRMRVPCRYNEGPDMDTTTLIIIIMIVLLLGGGGWYGRGRWF